MVDQDEVLVAEHAALNMAVSKCLRAITSMMEIKGMDGKEWLNAILENGLLELAEQSYGNVATDRRDTLVEVARARYTDIIVASR